MCPYCQISNCQSLGRKNKHEILKTDRSVPYREPPIHRVRVHAVRINLARTSGSSHSGASLGPADFIYRASIYWCIRGTQGGTVSSNSSFQAGLLRQYSANLSKSGVEAPRGWRGLAAAQVVQVRHRHNTVQYNNIAYYNIT